ncbi:hypothetical protein Bbelb_124670 [Branchiostoma belcheri]|nr:hypothetical protein Bbelb_124670 [Branchiostoma belcheri]
MGPVPSRALNETATLFIWAAQLANVRACDKVARFPPLPTGQRKPGVRYKQRVPICSSPPHGTRTDQIAEDSDRKECVLTPSGLFLWVWSWGWQEAGKVLSSSGTLRDYGVPFGDEWIGKNNARSTGTEGRCGLQANVISLYHMFIVVAGVLSPQPAAIAVL